MQLLMDANEERELKDSVQKIKFYLEDDPSTDKKGLVSQVNDIQHTLDELLQRETVFRTKAGIISSIAGVIGAILALIGKHLMGKFFGIGLWVLLLVGGRSFAQKRYAILDQDRKVIVHDLTREEFEARADRLRPGCITLKNGMAND